MSLYISATDNELLNLTQLEKMFLYILYMQ